MSFDGVDDEVIIPNISQLITSTNTTLMGWFKSTSNGQPNLYYEGLFGFRDHPNYLSIIIPAMNGQDIQILH